jgi:hypothetical protein
VDDATRALALDVADEHSERVASLHLALKGLAGELFYRLINIFSQTIRGDAHNLLSLR